jgi:hypothetical protein
MRRYLVEYSVCDFESEQEFDARNVFEAQEIFMHEVIEKGGLETSDVDWIKFTELSYTEEN